MKKLLITLALAASTLAGYSQTNVPPTPPTNWLSSPILTFIQQTNLMYALYGIVDSKGEKWGGGVALAYRVTPILLPTFRLDYWDGQVWQPNANLQLQAPIYIAGKYEIDPFIFDGPAFPLTGKGSRDGEVVNIAGAGIAFRIPVPKHWYIPQGGVFDVEIWSGAGYDNVMQFRAGVWSSF